MYRLRFCLTQDVKELTECVNQLRLTVAQLASMPIPPQNPMPSGNGSPLQQGRPLVATRQQQQRNALNVLESSNANASADIGYELTSKIKAAAFAKDFFDMGLGRFTDNGTSCTCDFNSPKWRLVSTKAAKDARVEARKLMGLFRWVASEDELRRISAAYSTNAAQLQLQLEDKKAACDAVVERIRDVYLPCLEGVRSNKTGDTVTALYGRWKIVGYRFEQPKASFGSSSSALGILSWEKLQQIRQEEDATAAAAVTALLAVQGGKPPKVNSKKRARTKL